MKQVTRLFALVSLFCFGATSSPASEPRHADVIVYGSTPGGFCAAIAAAREGASVVLLEPTDHVGAMNTGGLSHYGSNQMVRSTLMGLFNEWHTRVVKDYTDHGLKAPYNPAKKDQSRWTFEPHVAMRVTMQVLDEARVTVLTERYLKSLTKEGSQIYSGKKDSKSKGDGTATATFRFKAPKSDRYQLLMAYSAHETRAKNVPVTVSRKVRRRLPDRKCPLVRAEPPGFTLMNLCPTERHRCPRQLPPAVANCPQQSPTTSRYCTLRFSRTLRILDLIRKETIRRKGQQRSYREVEGILVSICPITPEIPLHSRHVEG